MKIEYAELEGIIVGMNSAVTGLHKVDVITHGEHLYLVNGAQRILEILKSFSDAKALNNPKNKVRTRDRQT